MIPTTRAVTARSFETAIALAVTVADETGEAAIMLFDDIAVQVDPGDSNTTVARNHDAIRALVAARLLHRPLLSERAPALGDVIETVDDDHATRIPRGTAGIVTDLVGGIGTAPLVNLVVRFARRTVDYAHADLHTLRHLR
ncbi:hypothetical protein [Sphingomonas montana]|uniref:hypothetical protein n=1 Tax=Sphingomonas montana TaxID=1843236 RepID=UPI00096C7D04|nr:hypothetical protein [Sphingomonas montana]